MILDLHNFAIVIGSEVTTTSGPQTSVYVTIARKVLSSSLGYDVVYVDTSGIG